MNGNQQSLSRMMGKALWSGLYYNPVTTLLLAACIITGLLTGFGSTVNPDNPLFYPPDFLAILFSGVGGVGEGGEGGGIDSNSYREGGGSITTTTLLRTLSPALLHFGAIHLVFNLLWLWFFGRQLERMQGSWLLLTLVIAVAFISNSAQFLFYGNQFGGMSGVVYGLVGYSWCLHYFMPHSYLMFNGAMFTFFLVWLVVAALLPGFADAAHVAGLTSGAIAGLVVVTWYTFVLDREVVGKPWR